MTEKKKESDFGLLSRIKHFDDVEGVVAAARAIKEQRGETGRLGEALLQSVEDQDALIERLIAEGIWERPT